MLTQARRCRDLAVISRDLAATSSSSTTLSSPHPISSPPCLPPPRHRRAPHHRHLQEEAGSQLTKGLVLEALKRQRVARQLQAPRPRPISARSPPISPHDRAQLQRQLQALQRAG